MGFVAAGDRGRSLRKIAGANLNADWDTLFDPLPILHAAAQVALVDLDVDRVTVITDFSQRGGDLVGRFKHGGAGFFLWCNGNDYGVSRGDTRRQSESVVVAMGHDERADQPRG